MPLSACSALGLFISFEGIDGAGKSSHIEALAQAFAAQGRSVTRTREPGGTALAEKLRTLLLHDSMDALTEALLVFAGRRDHLIQVIEPALAQGHVVLCDRFTDATFAYQGAGRGFDLSTLSVLEHLVQNIPRPPITTPITAISVAQSTVTIREPDATVWFDVPVSVAAERLITARVPDRFEAQPQVFFEHVAQGYAQRAAAAPQRFIRIDAAQPLLTVREHLLAALVQRGYLNGAVS